MPKTTIYAIMVKRTLKGTSWKKGQFVSNFVDQPVGQKSAEGAILNTNEGIAIMELKRALLYVAPEDLFEIVPFEAELTVKKQAKRTSRKVKPKKAGR